MSNISATERIGELVIHEKKCTHINSAQKKTHAEKRNKRFISVWFGHVNDLRFFFSPNGYYPNCKYTVPTDELNRANVLFFLCRLNCTVSLFFTSFRRMARAICCMALFSLSLTTDCYWCCFCRCECCCCLLSWDQLNVQRSEKNL